MMRAYAVVSKAEAAAVPYPYVYVEENGSFRELRRDERVFLEEEFCPADGGRPYVKLSYTQRSPDGKMSGFMQRRKLPKALSAGDIPQGLAE